MCRTRCVCVSLCVCVITQREASYRKQSGNYELSPVHEIDRAVVRKRNRKVGECPLSLILQFQVDLEVWTLQRGSSICRGEMQYTREGGTGKNTRRPRQTEDA